MTEPAPQHELLSALHDGEMTATEAEAAAQRLAASPEDRVRLGEYRRLSELLRDLPRESAPAGTRTAILAHIERESLLSDLAAPPRRNRFRTWRPVAGTIAAGLLVGVIAWQSGVRVTRQPVVSSNSGSTEFEIAAVEETRDAAPAASRITMSTPRPSPESDTSLRSGSFAMDVNRDPTSEPVGEAGGLSIGAATGPADFEMLGADEPLSSSFVTESRPRVGEVITFLEQNEGQLVVVRATVVDVRQAMDTLQVLLARNAVPTRNEIADNTNAADENRLVEEEMAASEASRRTGGTGGKKSKDDRLAVYVESTPTQIVATLGELKESKLFLEVTPVGIMADESLSQADVAGASPADAAPSRGLEGSSTELQTQTNEPRSSMKQMKSSSPVVAPSVAQAPSRRDLRGAIGTPATPVPAEQLPISPRNRSFQSVVPVPRSLANDLGRQVTPEPTAPGRRQASVEQESIRMLFMLSPQSPSDPIEASRPN